VDANQLLDLVIDLLVITKVEKVKKLIDTDHDHEDCMAPGPGLGRLHRGRVARGRGRPRWLASGLHERGKCDA